MYSTGVLSVDQQQICIPLVVYLFCNFWLLSMKINGEVRISVVSNKIFNLYHPQRSCGKVMFLHMSVILSTGGCLADTPWADTPDRHHWADTPPGQTPLARHPPGQTPPGQSPPRTDTPWVDTPLGRHPPGQTSPGQTSPGQTPWADTPFKLFQGSGVGSWLNAG